MNESTTEWKLNSQNLVNSETSQSQTYSLEKLKYFFIIKKESSEALIFHFHYEILAVKYNSFVVVCIQNQNKEKNYTFEISFPIKSNGESEIEMPIKLNDLLNPDKGWLHDENSLILSIKVKLDDLTNYLKRTFKMIDYNTNKYSITDTFTIVNVNKNINQRISSSFQLGKDDEISFCFEGRTNPAKKIQLDLVFTNLNITQNFSVFIRFQNRDHNNSKTVYENLSFSPENLRHSFVFDISESDFNESNGWLFRGSSQFQFKVANYEFSDFPKETSFPNQHFGVTSEFGHRLNRFPQSKIDFFGSTNHENPINDLPSINPHYFHHKDSEVINFHGYNVFNSKINKENDYNFNKENGFNFNKENGFNFNEENGFNFNEENGFNFNEENGFNFNKENGFNFNKENGFNFNKENGFNFNKENGFNFNLQQISPNNENVPISDFGINKNNEIGLAGLQNQGATCYLNSAIQLLFHIPAFRKVVYQMNPDENSNDKSDKIALSLQKLFIQMQVNNKGVCSTSDLTKSFGWSQMELITEHDVQEFIRTLIDSLETKIRGTKLDGEIAKIFRGKSCTVVKAKKVKYESVKGEFFYDLPLDVRGSANLEESLVNFLKPEELSGNNMYIVDGIGPQEAEMYTEFVEFPSVLQIHLKRFEYDQQTRMECKINDRFEFPASIDLSKFLNTDNSKSGEQPSENVYDLYCILVHEGFAYLGHYYAFIRQILTSENDEESDKKIWKFNDDLNTWFKFNDSFVTKSSYSEAVVNNYGGSYTANSDFGSPMQGDKFFSAYMIVYVRRDKVIEIMKPLTDDEIPQNLREFTKKLREKEKENNSYFDPSTTAINGGFYHPRIDDHWDHFGHIHHIQNYPGIEEKMEKVSFMTEDYYFANLTKDFFELNIKAKKIKTELSSFSTVDQIYKAAEKIFKTDEGTIRLWVTTGDLKPYKPFCEVEPGFIPTKFFVQRKEKTDPIILQNQFSTTAFIFFFDISLELPGQYIGSTLVKKNDPISSVFKFANNKLGFPESNEFLTYQEKGGPNPFTLVDDDCQLTEKTAFIVLQLKKNCPITSLKSSYKWKTKEDLINSLVPFKPIKTNDKIPFYNLIEEKRERLSEASSYFLAIKRYIYITFYMMKNQNVPLIRIKYSTAFSINELADFVADKLKLKYDKTNDSILFFSNFVNSTKISPNFMTDFHNVEFNKEYKYYIQEIRGINFENIQKAQAIQISIALDGYNVSYHTKVYIENETQVFAILSDLIEEKVLSDSIFNDENESVDIAEEEGEGDCFFKAMSWLEEGKIRIYKIVNHLASSPWENEDVIPNDTYEIKIDVVPKEQRELSSNQKLIKGSHKREFQNIELPCFYPFYFVIDYEERVRDLKERLKKFIKLNEPWDCCSIFLGNVSLDASKDPIKTQYIIDNSNCDLKIIHHNAHILD